MGEIHMAQGAALVHTTLQAPTVTEVDLDEAIAVATRHGGCADRDRHQLIRVDRLELQLIAPLFQAQTKADVEVLSAAAKGITVAVQIAAADAAEVERVQRWIHQSIRPWCPAPRSCLDLFEHKKFPVALPDRLSKNGESLLLQRLAVEHCPCRCATWQHQSKPQADARHCRCPWVGSRHVINGADLCCTELRMEESMADERGRVVAAATDGACSGNPGPGGWGALIRFEDGSVEEFGGHEPATTNNRMELQAALALLQRLKALPRHPDLTLRTDSKYLIDGLGSWMAGWKRKGWKTAAGKPVLNQDLWQALDQARLDDVPLAYVKGHSGDPDNERVDRIAVAYSRGQALTSIPAPPPPSASDDAAPPELQRLLTRLELAERLAAGAFTLTAAELAQLVEQPLQNLQERSSSWRWRDWSVDPVQAGRWRLRRREGGSEQS